MKIVSFLLLLALPAQATDDDALRAALREAHRANDAAALVENAGALRKTWPGHPEYSLLQARGQALQGDAAAALRTLQELTARGVDLLAAVERDDAFTELRNLPQFAELHGAATGLREPVGAAQRAWQFGDADTVPEAIALGPVNRVYLGSVHKGEVLVRDADGRTRRWPAPRRWSVLGMHPAPRGGTLWAATAAMNVSAAAAAGDRGRSGIAAFDTDTGNVLAHHVLELPGEHVLGDFIFIDERELLATDSAGGGVYALDLVAGKFEARVAPGKLRSPQGLARIGGYVYVADYSKGLYRLELATNRLQKVDDGPAAPYGIDGLYAHAGALIAVQNGVRPAQVARFTLSAAGDRIVARETLLANHADFEEPTLAAIDGQRLLLVANSQWNHFDANGKLPNPQDLASPVILALALSRMP